MLMLLCWMCIADTVISTWTMSVFTVFPPMPPNGQGIHRSFYEIELNVILNYLKETFLHWNTTAFLLKRKLSFSTLSITIILEDYRYKKKRVLNNIFRTMVWKLKNKCPHGTFLHHTAFFCTSIIRFQPAHVRQAVCHWKFSVTQINLNHFPIYSEEEL